MASANTVCILAMYQPFLDPLLGVVGVDPSPPPVRAARAVARQRGTKPCLPFLVSDSAGNYVDHTNCVDDRGLAVLTHCFCLCGVLGWWVFLPEPWWVKRKVYRLLGKLAV